jgi:hypothetical protein
LHTFGQGCRYLLHEWQEIVPLHAARDQDHNHKWQLRDMLLKREIAVDGDECIEVRSCQCQQSSGLNSGLTPLRYTFDFMPGQLPRQSPVEAFVEQDVHLTPRCRPVPDRASFRETR